MKNRPKIKLRLSPIDKLLEFIGWISILGIWGITLYNFNSLPDQIPIHYTIAGEADRFGSSWNIFLLPLIASTLFIGISILSKYPHKFNYPAVISPHNAAYQYTIATRMLRFLKISIVFVFGLLLYETLKYVDAGAENLGVWSLPLILILILAPVGYFIVLGARRDSSSSETAVWLDTEDLDED